MGMVALETVKRKEDTTVLVSLETLAHCYWFHYNFALALSYLHTHFLILYLRFGRVQKFNSEFKFHINDPDLKLPTLIFLDSSIMASKLI